MVSVDLTGVGKSAPAGSYEVIFTDYKMKKTQKGDDMAVLELTIDDSDEDNADYNGSKFWQNLVLTPKSLFQFKRSAIALGADAEDLDGLIEVEEILDELKGNRAIVVVKDTGDEKYPTAVDRLTATDL